MNVMEDLVQFLRARYDEDAAEAQATADEYGAVWTFDEAMDSVRSDKDADVVEEPGTPRTYIARHDPARVLAEVDAKRQLVDRYERAMENRRAHPEDLATAGALLALHGAVKLLALPYANYPGYHEEWRP